VLLNDSATPATDASWELPVKVKALAKWFARGGSVTYQELPDRWSEGLGELTGHLIGDGWLTDVQTAGSTAATISTTGLPTRTRACCAS